MTASDGESRRLAPVIPLFEASRSREERDDRDSEPSRAPGRGDEPRSGRSAERAARQAQNVSVAALTRRGMSVAELRDRLTERGIAEEEIENELERLQNARYLDDAALAESVIRTETERKGKGRSAVVAELRRRRVDDAAMASALELLDDQDERERALEAAERRARQLSSYDDETARRRLAGFLQRRGFGGDVLHSVLDQVMRDRP